MFQKSARRALCALMDFSGWHVLCISTGRPKQGREQLQTFRIDGCSEDILRVSGSFSFRYGTLSEDPR